MQITSIAGTSRWKIGPFLFLFLFISMPFLQNCSEKEEPQYRTSQLELPLLKGFELRDATGNNLGNIGVPNIKTRINNIVLTPYPNPCQNDIIISTSAPNTLKKLWIVPGKTDNTTTGKLNDLGMQTFIAGGTPVLQTRFYEPSIMLDVSALKKGPYRIYLQIGDDLLYDNILVNIPLESLFK
jgi:hypothetical protein